MARSQQAALAEDVMELTDIMNKKCHQTMKLRKQN